MPLYSGAAVLAALAPICFNQACQEATDRALIIALTIPVVTGLLALAYVLRPPPKELEESGAIFEDEATGIRFEAPEGVTPERDRNGELAFRAISYTPWPVEASYEGERVRIAVGLVADRQLRTYVFSRTLPGSSSILTVTLPRPLGIVLEYDDRRKRATVADLVEGTHADQRRKLASMSPDLASANAVLPGDVLRAVTCTNFVYPTRALFGAVPPERHIVVYGADKQGWASLCAALKKGDARDGEVTVVLERRRTAAAGAAGSSSSSSSSFMQ